MPKYTPHTAFAPYWYIDEQTECFIDVTNYRSFPLTLVALLRTLDGAAVQLPPIDLPGFASKRVRLNDHVPARTGIGTSSTGPHATRWGNGSLSNSAVGCAELNTVHPDGADAKAFCAWIVVENARDRIGLVASMFRARHRLADHHFEANWWFPYPDASVQYALQNCTEDPLQIKVEVFERGLASATVDVQLPPSSMRLLDVDALLDGKRSFDYGGIRFLVESSAVREARPKFFGRGTIIADTKGFASPIHLHEILTDADDEAHYELHSPTAFFGKMENVVKGMKGSVASHVLVKNTSNHARDIEILLDGKNHAGTAGTFTFGIRSLSPQASLHVNLDEARRASQSELVDGVAGLRLKYQGGATDVVADLINVGDSGRFLLYEYCRNSYYQRPQLQVAIALQADAQHESCVILKNVTNQPQEAKVLVHFHGGAKTYDVDVRTILPAQTEVINIKALRDWKIEDRNGKVLPDDFDSCSATIRSAAGAFVASDPTFMIDDDKEGWGGESCVDTGNIACAAAESEITLLRGWVKKISQELASVTPDTQKVAKYKEHIAIAVGLMIEDLDDYIAAGCCKPHLVALEMDVDKLPWPNLSDVQAQHQKLKKAIQEAQKKAAADFVHC